MCKNISESTFWLSPSEKIDYQCFSNNCSCLIYHTHTQNFHICSKWKEKYSVEPFCSNLARGVTNLSNLTTSQVISVLKKWHFEKTMTMTCVKRDILLFILGLYAAILLLWGLYRWQNAADTAVDIAVGTADSIGLSWPNLIECGLGKSTSNQRVHIGQNKESPSTEL